MERGPRRRRVESPIALNEPMRIPLESSLPAIKGLKARTRKLPLDRKFVLGKTLVRPIDLYGAWDKLEQAQRWREELESLKSASDYAEVPAWAKDAPLPVRGQQDP